MLLTTRHILIALGPVVAFSMGAPPTSNGAPIFPVPECKVAAAWVAKHARELPTTERELTSFSVVYRKAIFGALPIQVQERLWREHLTSFVRDDSPLNPLQQSIVAEAIANLHEFFDPEATSTARKDRARQFMLRLSGSFPKDLQGMVFSRLGGGPTSTQTLSSLFSRPAAASSFLDSHRLSTRLGLSRVGSQVCWCHVSDQDCDMFVECVQQGPACTETDQGCGPFWLDSCNGTCAE